MLFRNFYTKRWDCLPEEVVPAIQVWAGGPWSTASPAFLEPCWQFPVLGFPPSTIQEHMQSASWWHRGHTLTAEFWLHTRAARAPCQTHLRAAAFVVRPSFLKPPNSFSLLSSRFPPLAQEQRGRWRCGGLLLPGKFAGGGQGHDMHGVPGALGVQPLITVSRLPTQVKQVCNCSCKRALNHLPPAAGFFQLLDCKAPGSPAGLSCRPTSS